MHALFYLKDFGAVFKGVRVADIIDQADNVAGQIGIRQVVEVGEHFMKLRGEYRLLQIYSVVRILKNHLNTVSLRIFSGFCWCTDAAVQRVTVAVNRTVA